MQPHHFNSTNNLKWFFIFALKKKMAVFHVAFDLGSCCQFYGSTDFFGSASAKPSLDSVWTLKSKKSEKCFNCVCFFFLHICMRHAHVPSLCGEWWMNINEKNGEWTKRPTTPLRRRTFDISPDFFLKLLFKNGAPRWLTRTWAEITDTDNQHAKFRQ